jgi:uncharacterized membrane protein YkvA (DUF1232 family)
MYLNWREAHSWLMIEQWKQRVRQLKSELYALYLACRDPRVPWYARLAAICVVAYAFSPVDLIPDFVPVLGYLDDLILVPLGIILVRRMVPDEVLEDCRLRASDALVAGRPTNWVAATVIIAIWIALAAWVALFVWDLLT